MKLIFLLLLMLVLSSFARASCGLSVSANNIDVNWDTTFARQSVSVVVSKTNPAACTFGLAFSKGTSASYARYGTLAGGQQLKYQLYGDAAGQNVLKNVPDASVDNDVIMVTLPPGSGPQTVQYFFDIPYATATAPVLAAAGIYADAFTISAYEGTDPSLFSDPPETSAVVNVSINVEKQIKISLIDSGNVFQDNSTTKTINFGKLTAGQISRFSMAVQTNAGMSITMQSTNSGKLKHATLNSVIPYTLSVNNSAADLTGVVPVVVAGGSTSIAGLIYSLKIIIGNVSAMNIAGSYADTVTITAVVTD